MRSTATRFFGLHYRATEQEQLTASSDASSELFFESLNPETRAPKFSAGP